MYRNASVGRIDYNVQGAIVLCIQSLALSMEKQIFLQF